MILFIGGPTHTGKTMLAQRLMERLRAPYLSVDHLKMGLFRGWPGCGFHPEGSQEQREGDYPDPGELLEECEALRAQCLAQGAQLFEIDGDYEQAMLDIIAWVDARANKICKYPNK